MTAADLILQKALVGSKINSTEWSRIQAGLRDRAFFSATVEDVRLLHTMREAVAQVASQKLDPSEARLTIRKALDTIGYSAPEGKEGSLRDLRTKARLDLIIKTNRDQAHGFLQYKQFTTKSALEEFPASRLVRVKSRRVPRDWHARWNSAAAAVAYDGVLRARDMVALKTSPIWTAISRFGHPYPPFDFNSGMGVENVSISEAISIGLVKKDDPPQKVPDIGFNDALGAEIPNLRNDSLCADILHQKFGDQISIENSKVNWQGNLIQDVLEGRIKRARLGKGFNGQNLSLSHQFLVEHGSKHLNPEEPGEHLTKQEFELLPSLWRNPDRILPTRDPNRFELDLDTLDGGYILAIIDRRDGLKSIQKKLSGREHHLNFSLGASKGLR